MAERTRLTAAVLRGNLSEFESSLRDRRDAAARGYHDAPVGSPSVAAYEGRWIAYVMTLDSLHTWTDGEYGEPWDMDHQPQPPEPHTAEGTS